MAITSLGRRIVSFLIPILPSSTAVICSHPSRSRVEMPGGTLVGKAMARVGRGRGSGILVLLAAIGLVVLGVMVSNWIEADQIAEEIRRGKEIHRLVLKYEADHGKFPDTLGELVTKGYIRSLDHLQPTRGGNWIYFVGLTSKSSDSMYIIRSEHHKVVIYVDGTSGDRNLSYTTEPIDYPMRGHESVRE